MKIENKILIKCYFKEIRCEEMLKNSKNGGKIKKNTNIQKKKKKN